MAAMAAHQPPADHPIVAQEVRSGRTRSVRCAQSGTSRVSQVSTFGSRGVPSTHSVSRPAGISTTGETMMGSTNRWASTTVATASAGTKGPPGYPGKASKTG